VDGYDPHTLETLALWADQPLRVRIDRHGERLAILQYQCQAGDFFICASERQRDWWLGVLELCGRINPHTYDDDPTLRDLIDTVPYGLPSEAPQATRPVLRSVWPGITKQDVVLLWGGGLWEWLDPLTAVRAARRLIDRNLAVRLVFPGARHPNRAVPEMPMRAQTLALADELGLTGQHVFFGDWVPYQDWPAVLLEADLGLALHPNTAEAHLAYRSRVLDYVWAGLPMVVTRGDVLSEVVDRRGLGRVVDYGDDAGVADAIEALLERPRSAWQERFAAARAEMTWERAARPLVEFCRNPRRTSDRNPLLSAKSDETDPDLAQVIVDCEAEVARLRDLVAGYEQGRLMRLARRMQRWREKLGA
jgi:glycosyltransferase involved in cell wall biosynthesis